jgi:hypothetical protein
MAYVQWMALVEHEAKHLALRHIPKFSSDLDRYCGAIGQPPLASFATGTEENIRYSQSPELSRALKQLGRYLDELAEDLLDDDEPPHSLAHPASFKAVRAELADWNNRLAEALEAGKAWGLVLISDDEQ